MLCISVVVSGDFCCFKLALPSLLSMSKDEVQGCTLRFRPWSTQRWFTPRKSSRSAFFSATLNDLRPLPKLLEHFAGNERFLPGFPSSLLSGYALNTQTGHGRERNLVTRSIFSLPQWSGRLMYNTYPIPTETPRLNLLS